MNSSERGNEQQSATLDHQNEKPFAAEERFGAAPLCVHRQTGIAGEVGTGLNKERLVAEFDRGDVARRAGREGYFTRTAASGEGRYECRFTTGSPLDRAEESALHLRLQFDVR